MKCLPLIAIIISFLLFQSKAQCKNTEIHDPSLACPEIQLTSLKGRYEIESYIGSKNIVLRFLWNDNERSPQLNLQAELFNRNISDIFKFFQEHFDEKYFPTEINLVQTNLANGLGALYCRSYQSDPKKSVTLFFSPKSLESSPEFTRLLAHELTHHWFYKNGKKAATWIEEGLAYLSEYLVTGQMSGQPVTRYLNHSSASLTQTDVRTPMQQMGHAQLLFIYLYEKLGDPFLNQLLSTEMANVEQVERAIPTNNKYQWRSFQEAFKDFQIAKYLNRQDYWATSEIERTRYFLFPTTLRAVTSDSSSALEWSALEYNNWALLKNSPPPKNQYEDLVLIDEPNQSISVHKASGNFQSGHRRYLRIIYQ